MCCQVRTKDECIDSDDPRQDAVAKYCGVGKETISISYSSWPAEELLGTGKMIWWSNSLQNMSKTRPCNAATTLPLSLSLPLARCVCVCVYVRAGLTIFHREKTMEAAVTPFQIRSGFHLAPERTQSPKSTTSCCSCTAHCWMHSGLLYAPDPEVVYLVELSLLRLDQLPQRGVDSAKHRPSSSSTAAAAAAAAAANRRRCSYRPRPALPSHSSHRHHPAGISSVQERVDRARRHRGLLLISGAARVQ